MADDVIKVGEEHEQKFSPEMQEIIRLAAEARNTIKNPYFVAIMELNPVNPNEGDGRKLEQLVGFVSKDTTQLDNARLIVAMMAKLNIPKEAMIIASMEHAMGAARFDPSSNEPEQESNDESTSN